MYKLAEENYEKTPMEEIEEYLNKNNKYWLSNNVWNLHKVMELTDCKIECKRIKNMNFKQIIKKGIQKELKYCVMYALEKKLIIQSDFQLAIMSSTIKHISKYIKHANLIKSIMEIADSNFKIYLLNIEKISQSNMRMFSKILRDFKNILSLIYDKTEETQKDIWDIRKVNGAIISVTYNKSYFLNFSEIPKYYRECVKKYFRTIITKRSMSHVYSVYEALKVFFRVFYDIGYKDGFIKDLRRDDIENYLIEIHKKYKNTQKAYYNKFISYSKTFLEYIQIAEYEEAPKRDVGLLIFKEDIPTRESNMDIIKNVKFIPTPIMEQIDSNIKELDKPEYIPIYILLRETGWRGADILNLKFDNCLEKIWNEKEKQYNSYLCGEITKTGIAELKIPIRDSVSDMLEKCILEAKKKSTNVNNPKKYLFNIYEGRRVGLPIRKENFVSAIKRLIEKKDIRDADGELYNFKTHSLRHTRAKEYVEQGVSISIIQQILGHRSLQMTVHYAKVTENTLYEKWKETEELNLFQLDNETKKLHKIDVANEKNDKLIKYEYVKRNLDAVKVPFGICFKSNKIPCKQQMNHCLSCASFCTTIENIYEYEEEITRVKKQIEISEACGRLVWKEKNEQYLEILQNMLQKIKEEKIVHKNGNSREEF